MRGKQPQAISDSFRFQETAAMAGNLIANDKHPCSGSLILTSFDGKAVDTMHGAGKITDIAGDYGTFHVKRDGTFTYTIDRHNAAVKALDAGETLTESLTYKVANSFGLTDTAKLKMVIKGVTEKLPPDAKDDAFSFHENAAMGGNLLANDKHPSSGSLILTSFDGKAVDTMHGAGKVTDIAGDYGTFHVKRDGTFTYTIDRHNAAVKALDAGETLTESLTYKVANSFGLTDTAKLKMVILGMNENAPPLAADRAYNAVGTRAVNGQAFGFDEDGDAITITRFGDGPQHGSLVFRPDGSFSYTAKGDWFGTDSFQYAVADGNGGEALGTITLNLSPLFHDYQRHNITLGSNGISIGPVISADGSTILFSSSSSNLTSGDTNGRGDLFLYDKQNGHMVNITQGDGSDTSGAFKSGGSFGSLSEDGRTVVYESVATDLTPGDTNGQQDIFLYTAGSTVNITANGNGESSGPRLSRDGNTVAFESLASNLTAGDVNDHRDVFIFEANTGVINLTEGGNGESTLLSMSGDGSRIVFTSAASNLTTGDINGVADVFLYDRTTGVTINVTQAGDAASDGGYISADGSTILFTSSANNFQVGDRTGSKDLFLYDVATGQISPVTTAQNGSFPAVTISGDGTKVAFSSTGTVFRPGDPTGPANEINTDIFFFDKEDGKFTKVTSRSNDDSYSPILSEDGSTLLFFSKSAGLTPDDNSAGHQLLYAYDTKSAAISMVVPSFAINMYDASISKDASTIAFHAASTNGDSSFGPSNVFYGELV
jgi:VCBS repeat-containing protein